MCSRVVPLEVRVTCVLELFLSRCLCSTVVPLEVRYMCSRVVHL